MKSLQKLYEELTIASVQNEPKILSPEDCHALKEYLKIYGNVKVSCNVDPNKRYKIKLWPDMAEEYGVDDTCDICYQNTYFVESMKSLCGKECRVEGKNLDGSLVLSFLDEDLSYFDTLWNFYDWMLEEIK